MVTWDEITAECDGYRAGFVAVFRMYDGQPTDEKDAQGRTVKVTATSFARHVGVEESTFRRWVKTSSSSGTGYPSDTEAGARAARSGLRRALRELPADEVAREVAKVAPDAVFEVAMEQSGRTRTTAPRSNVEDIYGPFVKVRHALGQLRRLLPDFAAGEDIRDEAEDTIADLRGTAKIIRDWLDGQDIAEEVEKWLQATE
jgi:transposase-like protein